MNKENSPYKVYIEMYCKDCEWFSLKTDDLSTEQYKTMKKCIDKCAIVRMAINTEPIKITTSLTLPEIVPCKPYTEHDFGEYRSQKDGWTGGIDGRQCKKCGYFEVV